MVQLYDYNDSFGQRLMRLVRSRGNTVTSLSNAIGEPKKTVQDWYSGKSTPNVLQLKLIRRQLNVSWDELLGR